MKLTLNIPARRAVDISNLLSETRCEIAFTWSTLSVHNISSLYRDDDSNVSIEIKVNRADLLNMFSYWAKREEIGHCWLNSEDEKEDVENILKYFRSEYEKHSWDKKLGRIINSL